VDKLQTYLNTLTPIEQADFARRCSTTIGYLRKAISKGQRLGESICIAIERESKRVILCEDIRTDVDWAFLRNTPDVSRTSPAFADMPAPVQMRALAGGS
jgi:DNA-binding transcriptional regulator YdaS (Cro superfamily)